MNKRKMLWLFIFVTAILAGSYLINSARQTNATALANHPDVDTSIAFWQKRIEKNPRGYIEYTYLAEAYARKARESGDIGDYQRAEVVLRQALALNPKYTQTSVLLSGVLFAMHDFQAALEMAQPLASSNNTVQAQAILGDVHLALGDYAEAEAAYQKLSLGSPTPATYSRLAVLADLKGETDKALSLMEKASELSRQVGDYPESLAWYEYQVGELYFKSGRFKLAKNHYQASLKLFDSYYLALAGLGKVSAAGGDYDRAIEYYQQATRVIPQPDLLATLGDLYTLTGQTDQARLQYSTVETIGKLAQINQQIYNRQLANFYSDHDIHLDEALKLSMAELEVRKDIYGYDAAAWAAYKNGLLDQAQALIQQAMRLGTRDARLYYHAGMIAQAQGRAEEAKVLLEEALLINPQFDALQTGIVGATLEKLKKP